MIFEVSIGLILGTVMEMVKSLLDRKSLRVEQYEDRTKSLYIRVVDKKNKVILHHKVERKNDYQEISRAIEKAILKYENDISLSNKLLNRIPIIKTVNKLIALDRVNLTKQQINNESKKILISNSYYDEQASKLNKAIFVGFIIVLLSIPQNYLNLNSIFTTILGIGLIISTWSYKLILKYRISNGYFGTNYQEAMLLLEYIQKNYDDFDKGSKVFNDEPEGKMNLGNYIHGFNDFRGAHE